jgi:long-chain acyl-CoA synthetase
VPQATRVSPPGYQGIPRQVGDALDAGLASDPDKEAVVGSDQRLSYRQLDRAIDSAASTLYRLGVRINDPVAVSLPNRAEIVVIFYALARLGAVFVGINRGLAPPEKAYILSNCKAGTLVADAETAESLRELSQVGIVECNDDDRPGTWREGGSSDPGGYPRPLCSPDDAVGLAYTSGTTGRPKGVIHSHRNLLLPGAALIADRRYGPDLRRGDCAALTILNLQITSTLLSAQARGTQIVMDRVDPVGIASWIRGERVNSWFGVPTMIHGLAASEEVQVDDLRGLIDVWTGGSDISPSVRRAFEDRFDLRVHATYGMTEVPTVVTIESRHHPAVPGSSGRSLPHLVTRIRDEQGRVAPIGQTGEITIEAQVDGPWGGLYRPMLGYLDAPEATDETLRDGVLYTGDIGQLDEKGELFVLDRRGALILRGGANVYSAEVERVLLEVEGVVGAAVVGVPDDRLGQRVAAAVELSPDAEVTTSVLEAHCRLNLAKYKVPEFWRVAALPRNAMGKVVRPVVEGLFT